MTDSSSTTPPGTEQPVEGVDYDLVKRPYFSTPFMYWANCLHGDDYGTGKQTTAHNAVKNYTAHWQAKHAKETERPTPQEVEPALGNAEK